MKKFIKPLSYIIALAWNILFYYLLGYWKRNSLSDVFFDPDLLIGAIAIALTALAETRVFWQVYYRIRHRKMKLRTFDKRFWLQCLLLLLYHAGCLYLYSIIIYDYSIFYIAILAIVCSIGWLTGTKTLWTDEYGSLYLSESCVLYRVLSVTENTEVIEIACTGVGYRDVLVTIPQKFRMYS